jgi:hypothetical protein
LIISTLFLDGMPTSGQSSFTKEQLLQAQLILAMAKNEKKANRTAQKAQGKKKPRDEEMVDENQSPSELVAKSNRTIYVE